VTERPAEDWLRKLIDEARRGTLPGMVRTGVTFADAAAEWLRYIEHDRMRKPSTISTYRSLLGSRILLAFGSMPIESVTSEMIESWIASVDRTAATRVKLLAMVHGIFQRARKVWGLKVNPAVDVEKPPLSRSGDIEVFSPEVVWALVRAAASEQGAAIFLTAAFTGLRRGELLALHWRDVDFAGSVVQVRASYHEGVLSTPKSGKVRSVPLAPDVGEALAKLAASGVSTGDDDLVFVGEDGYLDGSALRRRYDAAIARAAGLSPDSPFEVRASSLAADRVVLAVSAAVDRGAGCWVRCGWGQLSRDREVLGVWVGRPRLAVGRRSAS
jgi:integrase